MNTAKQIYPLYLSRLRTNEVFGYLTSIINGITYLPDTGRDSAIINNRITQFKEAYKSFNDAINISFITDINAQASQADKTRCHAWSGTRNYIISMHVHPNEQVVSAAKEAKHLFDKYENPAKISNLEADGILHNLLKDLWAIDKDKRAALSLDIWLNDLEKKNNAYHTAVEQQREAISTKKKGIVKQTRLAAEYAYRQLVNIINATILIDPLTDYSNFINYVNALINDQKSILKTRQTKLRNKEEKEIL